MARTHKRPTHSTTNGPPQTMTLGDRVSTASTRLAKAAARITARNARFAREFDLATRQRARQEALERSTSTPPPRRQRGGTHGSV